MKGVVANFSIQVPKTGDWKK